MGLWQTAATNKALSSKLSEEERNTLSKTEVDKLRARAPFFLKNKTFRKEAIRSMTEEKPNTAEAERHIADMLEKAVSSDSAIRRSPTIKQEEEIKSPATGARTRNECRR